MVVNTWDGAANTNWDDAGNWNSTGTTDRIPTSSDDVIIPDTSSINNPTLRQDQPVQSLVMQANATVVGAGFEITIHGESSNVAIDNDAIISGDLDLEILTAGATTLDLAGTSGNFRDVIINHAACEATLLSATTIGRNLTITAGELDTDSSSNYALTVTGDVSVTGTLTGNASAISMGSLTIASGGTYSATSGTTTITSIKSGDKSLENQSGGTFTNNDGTVLFNSNADQKIEMAGTGNVHNVTLNKSDNDFIWMGNYTFEGNFDITLEATHQARPTGTGNTLTVTEDVIVREGILLRSANDCTGAMSFGSLTIESGGTYSATSGVTTITSEDGSGYALNHDGTFTHNSGTVTITTPTTTLVDLLNTGNINNLIVNHADARVRIVTHSTIEGDVTVTAGILDTAYDVNVTVTGDVLISSGGTLGNVDESGAHTFGSLTIASGGTHVATSGTTTLTGKDTGSGTSFLNAGTFTHNNGKVKVTYAAASTQLTSAAFYDLEIATGTVSYIVKLYHGTAVDIYNNLTLTSGVLDMYVADDLIDIHGLTNIASGARCWYSADDNTNTITHHGLVTNLGIFYINDGTTVKLNGGIRQLGTLTIS